MTQPTSSDNRLPVAVLGAGHMGRWHVRKYAELPGVRLVAVIDPDVARAKALAEPLGARYAAAWDESLGDIAAASVAVPTARHLAVAQPLMQRGVSVLIEKPLAPSVAEAQAIVDLAHKHDVIVQVGHTERFNPAVRAVERLNIHPKFIETQRISPFTFRSADVGVVFDMMIHDIDILLHLVRDEVARVDAVGVNVLGPHEDIANARVVCRRGAVANLTASRLALKTERKLRVFSESAYVSLDYQKKVGIAITLDKNLDVLKLAREHNFDDLSQLANLDFGKLVHVEPLSIDDSDPLGTELATFIDCVRQRKAGAMATAFAPPCAGAGATPTSSTSGAMATSLASPCVNSAAEAQPKAPPVTAEDGLAAVQLASRIVASLSSHAWDGETGERVGLAADLFGTRTGQ